MTLGQKIKRLREQAGYTQEELGEIVGVDRSAVAQWENAIAHPRMGNVRRLAEEFGITVSVLLDDSKDLEDSQTEQSIPERPFVRLRPLGRVHAGPFSDEEEGVQDLIEVPVSVFKRHPNAEAVLVEGDCMNRIIPEGMAVVIDPDTEPADGKIVVVETENHQALLRRMYRDNGVLKLVAESYSAYEDIVVEEGLLIRLIGTVIWVQSPHELDE